VLTDKRVCTGASTTWGMVASGDGQLTYEWQMRDWRGVWQTLSRTPIRIEPTRASNNTSSFAFLEEDTGPFVEIVIHGRTARAWPVRCLVTDSNRCSTFESNVASILVCPFDIDCSGATTADDLFIFINYWFAGCN
jgi:hypothetical protein